jgi:hypothetical protein
MWRAPSILITVLIAAATTISGRQTTNFASLNVCERVPIADVAAAVAGRALESRPVDAKGMPAARCVYGIEIEGARRALVIWMSPAADFDDFRKSASGAVDVRDVGDAAFQTTDADTKRVQLTTLRRGKVTVQVTADRAAWAEAVAKQALAKF